MSNKPHLLVVDDEADIREILHFNLENEGFEVDMADSAEAALELLNDSHKLILLDVMMHGMSGFRMAEKLRKAENNIPIIFLTAKDTENDMLTGFSIGADDYVAKPFSIKEVIARVKTILKRSKNTKNEKEGNIKNLVINELYIDLNHKQVKIGSELIVLTKKEFEILVLLATHPTQLFSRTDILKLVWDDGIVLDRTVDVHIARLRKKLGKYGDCIINRTGYGYCFVAE